MRKTFRMFYGVVVCMSLLIMTSCNKTGAVKEAAEKAASSCPLKMSVLGDITGISFADDAVVLDIAVDSAFKSNEKVNDFISKYLALELTKSTPELAAAMSEAGIGLKANIKPAGSDAVTAVALEGDGVKALSAQMTPERQMSEVLLSLYNADIAQGGVDLGNGFRVAHGALTKPFRRGNLLTFECLPLAQRRQHMGELFLCGVVFDIIFRSPYCQEHLVQLLK